MISEKRGNMLEQVTEGHIIHGCNALGVMGGGIALQIRNKWPEVYDIYMKHHKEKGLHLGAIIPCQVSEKLIVWNCITQETCGRNPDIRYVSYDAIDVCTTSFDEVAILVEDVPRVINFPLIGAGLANGNWGIIENIIDTNISQFEKVLWEL